MKKNKNNMPLIIVIIVLSAFLLISVTINVYLAFLNKTDAEKLKMKYVGNYTFEDEEWYTVLNIIDDNSIELVATSKTSDSEPYKYKGEYFIDAVEKVIVVHGKEFYTTLYYLIDDNTICEGGKKCDEENTRKYTRKRVGDISDVLARIVKTKNDDNNNSNNNNSNNNTQSDEDKNESYSTSAFNKIKAQDIENISKDTTAMIWIGRQTCSYCALYAPIVEKVQKNYGFKANYLDLYSIVDVSTSSIGDEDAYNILMNLKADNSCESMVLDGESNTIKCEDVLDERFGATPLTIFVKNNKLVGAFSGYVEEAELNKIVEKVGFSK